MAYKIKSIKDFNLRKEIVKAKKKYSAVSLEVGLINTVVNSGVPWVLLRSFSKFN